MTLTVKGEQMENISNYQPSKAVLTSLRTVNFVAVVGPTGAGKTTLITEATQRDTSMRMVITETTRPPRPGEKEGVNYYFKTRSDVLARVEKGEYVNVATSFNGTDIYASHRDSYPQAGVALMALFAQVVPEFRRLPFASFKAIFVIPASYEVWQSRVQSHHFTPEQKAKRLDEAIRSLEFACQDSDVAFVINDDIGLATSDFVCISTNQPLTARQQADQLRARAIAQAMLGKVAAM
jgi:guanylate kinase